MKNFIRRKENFECDKCGTKTEGDGYTDHCPNCLWGKHVDREIPGDRKSNCLGRLEPIRTVYKQGEYKIEYQCEKCGYKFRVREGEDDNRERLLELIKNDIIGHNYK